MSYLDVLKNIIKNNPTEYVKKETLRYEFSLYLEEKWVNTRLMKIDSLSRYTKRGYK